MTDSGRASVLPWLAGTLQVAGGAVLALGAVALVTPPLGCDRAYAVLAVVPFGLALVAWVVGNAAGLEGVAGALRRIVATTLGATTLVVAVGLGLDRALGDRLLEPSGALAVMCVGLVVAILGRLPRLSLIHI